MFVLRSIFVSGPELPARKPGFFCFGMIGTIAVDTAVSHRKSPAVTPRVPACKSVDRSCGKMGSRLFYFPYLSDPHDVPSRNHHTFRAPIQGAPNYQSQKSDTRPRNGEAVTAPP